MGNLLRRPVTFPNKLVEQPDREGSNGTAITNIWQNLEDVRSVANSRKQSEMPIPDPATLDKMQI